MKQCRTTYSTIESSVCNHLRRCGKTSPKTFVENELPGENRSLRLKFDLILTEAAIICSTFMLKTKIGK